MILLLDTANVEEIKKFTATDAVFGVTTNPSLISKESKGAYLEKVTEIGKILYDSTSVEQVKHLSVEAISVDPEEIKKQSLELSRELEDKFFPKLIVYVKIPVTFANLPVITFLKRKGLHVNATACMTASQAKMASDAGAGIVSFFYNRIKDNGEDPNLVLAEYRAMRQMENGPTADVICGSIRKKEDVFDAWRHGADFVTASAKIIESMTVHPQTDKAIAQFQKDIESWLK